MCDHAIIVGKECDFEEEKELSFPQLARFVFFQPSFESFLGFEKNQCKVVFRFDTVVAR